MRDPDFIYLLQHKEGPDWEFDSGDYCFDEEEAARTIGYWKEWDPDGQFRWVVYARVGNEEIE